MTANWSHLHMSQSSEVSYAFWAYHLLANFTFLMSPVLQHAQSEQNFCYIGLLFLQSSERFLLHSTLHLKLRGMIWLGF